MSAVSEDDVLEEIRRIAKAELDLEQEIAPTDALATDLALDSMGLIVLAVGLEDRFRVKLDDAAIAGDLRTVGDLARRIAQHARVASDVDMREVGA